MVLKRDQHIENVERQARSLQGQGLLETILFTPNQVAGIPMRLPLPRSVRYRHGRI